MHNNGYKEIFMEEKLRKLVKDICNILFIMSNIGLLMCCVVVFISVINKQRDMVILGIEMFVLFIFTLHFCSYFKDYLD